MMGTADLDRPRQPRDTQPRDTQPRDTPRRDAQPRGRPRRADAPGTGPAAADGPEPTLETRDVAPEPDPVVSSDASTSSGPVRTSRPRSRSTDDRTLSERERWLLEQRPPHWD
ncbi:hypothetical protein [Citricoccus sp. GCM10030269]|uniref:hypothetical protein n=1 Tax=Citricoccus sp. GCM10030269 TaxID=3273388 RepID=UPI00361EFF94